MPSTVRFMREFLAPSKAGVVAEETTYRRGDETLPATLYYPRRIAGPLPGWLTLHGLTYQGREHPSLRRLGRALAAAGGVVLVPDLPEWRGLRVAPRTTVRTIKAAVVELDALGITEPGRIGVMGFSFGATQALIAATDPLLEGRLAGVVSWGGYADIHRATRFAFLGEHELDHRVHRLEPDPYGRWILAGNYLGLLDEHSDGELAAACMALALEAGRRKAMAWEPALDPFKEESRRRLGAGDRALFDLIAPPTGVTLDAASRQRLGVLVDRMLAAALAREPLLDARPYLGRVPMPVFLAHGRGDRLVPWTEMVRLRRALPPDRVTFSDTTALFSHSTEERRVASPAAAVEVVRFIRLMHRMLRLI
jgi:pimeloyl-ACP methyl ester carboxylesterase